MPEPSESAARWRRTLRRPMVLLSLLVLTLVLAMAIFPGFFAGLFGNGDPRDCQLVRSVEPPAPGHPFGYDVQGCDLYANVIYGARTSLTIGLLASALMTGLSVVIGLVSGYFGGLLDAVIGRVSDVLLGFPFLLGAIVILTAMPERNVWTISFVLAIFSWPYLARVVRASVIGVKNLDYVTAARGLGASRTRLMFRHILPNAAGPALVVATLGVGGTIVAESGLTFLGIGLQVPAISWGLQIASAQTVLGAHPRLLLWPSLFISVTVIAFIVLGDALREHLDPRGEV